MSARRLITARVPEGYGMQDGRSSTATVRRIGVAAEYIRRTFRPENAGAGISLACDLMSPTA